MGTDTKWAWTKCIQTSFIKKWCEKCLVQAITQDNVPYSNLSLTKAKILKCKLKISYNTLYNYYVLIGTIYVLHQKI